MKPTQERRRAAWTAFIRSSSGTLFIYASLAGHKKQLRHGPPGKPCHHPQASPEIPFLLPYSPVEGLRLAV